jgi:hypothetical protein
VVSSFAVLGETGEDGYLFVANHVVAYFSLNGEVFLYFIL